MNDRTIKFIDATIGRLTVKLMGMGRGRNARPIPSWNLDDHSEFLLIRPGGIGDAALLAPLIRWLSDHGKTVDILCMQRNAGVFSILRSRGMIRHINHLDSPSDMIRLIRHHRYDVILDTEQSFYLSAVASRFIRRSIIIGFDTNERRNLYDAFVRYSQEDYEAESFMRLLEPFGIQERPIFTPVSRSRGNTLAVFAGASHPGRLWPPDHWREVLDRIGDRFDEVILIGGPAEKELNDKIAKAYRHKNLRNEAGNLTLGGTLEVLESVSHLLSTDSWPLHLGTLARVPHRFAIFGPGVAEKWGAGSHVIRRSIPCIGCNSARYSQTPPCPYKFACLQELTPDTVITSFLTHQWVPNEI